MLSDLHSIVLYFYLILIFLGKCLICISNMNVIRQIPTQKESQWKERGQKKLYQNFNFLGNFLYHHPVKQDTHKRLSNIGSHIDHSNFSIFSTIQGKSGPWVQTWWSASYKSVITIISAHAPRAHMLGSPSLSLKTDY